MILREAYELALLTGRSIDEIRLMPMEQFDEWRALFLLKAEDTSGT